uniref:Secreted protein n=1 Tax=Anopheles farauti TaxID=69004 RepID=A0A182PZB9_9DIPT
MNMRVTAFGQFWVTFGLLVAVVLMAAIVKATPLQCDDPDANAEATYGKLQSIPPPGGDTAAEEALADEPPSAVPSKTQQDVLKSRNSKFLGVERSSEEE